MAEQQAVTIQQALDLAKAHHKKGWHREAENICQQVLETEPDNFFAYHQLGLIAVSTGNEETAANLISKAVTINPASPQAYYDLGVVFQRLGKLQDADASYRKAIDLKQDFSEALNNLGTVRRELGNISESIQCYRNAINVQDQYAAAHSNLGLALHDIGDFGEALSSFRKALAINYDIAEVHYNLGTTLQALGRLSEAVESFRLSLSLNPNIAAAHTNLGLALRDLGKWDEASDSYKSAISINPDSAEAHHNLGMLQLLEGNYVDGWQNYGWRWKLRKRECHPIALDKPLWDGTKAYGKTIYVYSEQGLGDAIQFVRYLPLLKVEGYRVVLESPPSLKRLFQHSEVADEVIESGETPSPFDCHAALLDLPGLMRTTLQTIPSSSPYLNIDAELRGKWQDKVNPSGAFRVGIAWAGNSDQNNDRYRSVDASLFKPIIETPNVCVHSLQVGKNKTASEIFDRHVIDLAPSLIDFSETAAAMSCFDLIVSVDTSVAHLAGSLGLPIWVPLHSIAHWIYLRETDRCPWYPTMRLFRQKEFGNWHEVFENIRVALLDRLAHAER